MKGDVVDGCVSGVHARCDAVLRSECGGESGVVDGGRSGTDGDEDEDRVKRMCVCVWGVCGGEGRDGGRERE